MRSKQEILPEFDVDIIAVTVPYPGASPEEVEQGIVLSVEEELAGLDGVKRVNSTSGENAGTVLVELLLSASPDKVLNDVTVAVNRIATFPQNAEKPNVKLISLRREVIQLIISGDQELSSLHEIVEQARNGIRSDSRVSQVEVAGVPPPGNANRNPQRNLASVWVNT